MIRMFECLSQNGPGKSISITGIHRPGRIGTNCGTVPTVHRLIFPKDPQGPSNGGVNEPVFCRGLGSQNRHWIEGSGYLGLFCCLQNNYTPFSNFPFFFQALCRLWSVSIHDSPPRGHRLLSFLVESAPKARLVLGVNHFYLANG